MAVLGPSHRLSVTDSVHVRGFVVHAPLEERCVDPRGTFCTRPFATSVSIQDLSRFKAWTVRMDMLSGANPRRLNVELKQMHQELGTLVKAGL